MGDESPTELVRRFLAHWDTGDVAGLADFWADDGVYHNMPVQPAVGKQAIHAMISAFFTGEYGAERIHMEVINLVGAGNLVMAERLDTVTMARGEIQLPCTGVFEVRDGKITAFRDYFDLRVHEQALAALGS